MKRGLIIGIIIVAILIIGFGVYAFFQIATQGSLTCAKEGEVAASNPSTTIRECCEGLTEVASKNSFDRKCNLLEGGASICTDCGNNNCEDWESECNCPEDCE